MESIIRQQRIRRPPFSGVLALAFAATLLSGCGHRRAEVFQGYIEGEFVYVASPLSGALTNLAVVRGAEVKAGQGLFELEQASESAAVSEAGQRLAQARSRLENLTKGKRPSEIAALEGQLARAQADLKLAGSELQRQLQLRSVNVIAPDELDRARARNEAAQAQVESLEAELRTARLGGREDEVKAAGAEVEALAAAAAKARWAVDQKRQAAPADAVVHDTLYRMGEWVGAGKPVVVLLPPANLKVRFFVPQAALPLIKRGESVTVECDGAAQPYRATVNYISTQAEFTPPVIYSRENRAKLVFMVEATFAAADARALRPGQPADVKLENIAR